jgi:hypothetical protein
MPVKRASVTRTFSLTSSDGCGTMSATFQLRSVSFWRSRLIATYFPVCIKNFIRIDLVKESLNVGHDGRADIPLL